AKVFKKCKACHVPDVEKNKVGPHLVGIIGRAAGSVEGYKYSKAMKAKAGDIGNWDEANLKEFLVNPKKYLGGRSKMSFRLKKEDQRNDVIAYLKSLAK
ncbi:Cytochrome c2, partial [hydrothermal vent metagenome]